VVNPQSALSKAQRDWLDWAQKAHVPCLVTNSVQAATKFVIADLELKLE